MLTFNPKRKPEEFVNWPKPKAKAGDYNIRQSGRRENLLLAWVNGETAKWWYDYYRTRYNTKLFSIVCRGEDPHGIAHHAGKDAEDQTT